MKDQDAPVQALMTRLAEKQVVLDQLVEQCYDKAELGPSKTAPITADTLKANNITLPEAAEIITFMVPADEMSYYLDACDRHLALILSLMAYHITNTIMEHLDEHMDEHMDKEF